MEEESYRKLVSVDGVTTMLDVLDIACQEEYSTGQLPVPNIVHGGDGFLLMYSVESHYSFLEIRKFYNYILSTKRELINNPSYIVPMVLCGNKCDLADNQRQVTEKEGRDLADEWNIPFVEMSALDSTNVEKAFFRLVQQTRTEVPVVQYKYQTSSTGVSQCTML